MTATTPRYAIPYPQGTDRVMDGDNAIQAVADRVEAILGPVDDRSSLVPSGFRNVIRNGDMGVSQRGATGPFATGDGTVTIDGWTRYAAGTPTLSVGRAPFGVSLLPFAYYLTAAQTGAASAAGDYVILGSRIEDVRTLAGRQVTLSFYAGGTVGRTIGISVNQSFGTGGSPSTNVPTNVGSVVLSSGATTRYSVTFTVPTITGKTIGSNENSYVEIRFWMAAGSTNLAESGLGAAGGQAAWQLNLTGVQLEAGATATPFERLPQQQQLAWCQRYYYRVAPTVNGEAIGTGFMATTGAGYGALHFPVTMRAIPSMSTTAANGFTLQGSAGPSGGTGIACANTSVRATLVNLVSAGVGIAGGGCVVAGTIGAYIEAIAEL